MWSLLAEGVSAQSRLPSAGKATQTSGALQSPRTGGKPFRTPGMASDLGRPAPDAPLAAVRASCGRGWVAGLPRGRGPRLRPCALPTANVVPRHKPRARDRGRDRGAEASVRHLGEHGQRRQQDGEHWRARENPGEGPPGDTVTTEDRASQGQGAVQPPRAPKGHQACTWLAGDLRRGLPHGSPRLLRLRPPVVSGDGGDVHHPPGTGLFLRVPRADQCQGQR